jgi:hypothetical protein
MLRKALLCVFGVLSLTGLARADNVTLGPLQLHVDKQVNSKAEVPFSVSAAGKITVKIDSRTSSLLPNDPNIRVKIELLRPNGKPAVTKQPLVGFFGTQTTFTFNASELGNWKVRITNIDTSNQLPTDHTVTVTFPIATQTLPTDPSAPLTLLPGQSEEHTFQLNPKKTGKLEIKATWDTDFFGGGFLNPVPMHVELYRQGPNGSKVKVAQQDMKSPLTLTYQVKTADLANGTTWTLVIVNNNGVGIANFVAKVRFTPSAQ